MSKMVSRILLGLFCLISAAHATRTAELALLVGVTDSSLCVPKT
jgi:hypothetical protein